MMLPTITLSLVKKLRFLFRKGVKSRNSKRWVDMGGFPFFPSSYCAFCSILEVRNQKLKVVDLDQFPFPS